MEKFTREYAQKRAIEYVDKNHVGSRTSYLVGYTDCLEETNAPELLEALIKVDVFFNTEHTEAYDVLLLKEEIINAINKATL